MTSLKALAGMAGLVLLAANAAAQDAPATLQNIIEKQSPTVVSVRASIKTSVKGAGAAQDQESPMTMQGVLVAPTGLVMVSNMNFSPTRAMELMGAGRAGFDASSVKFTPTNIKVHFADDEKDYDGFLAATDTTLDLAFVQVEGLGDRKLPYVDFGSSGTAGLGQPVFGVARMPKGYDYAPFAQTGRVVGEIGKPRKAWILEGHVSNFGMPVYNASGQPIGALTTLIGGATDEASGEMGMGMFMRMMTGGGGNMGGAFVLPSSVVKSLVDQATKRAADLAVERAKKKAEAPAKAPEVKPAAGTKPAPAKPPKKP
jgi:hypothetical protein